MRASARVGVLVLSALVGLSIGEAGTNNLADTPANIREVKRIEDDTIKIDSVSDTCDNGFHGQQMNGICCSPVCSICGGRGCRSQGDGCCIGDIVASGVLCSESGEAPCIIDDEVCSNGLVGVEAKGVCCSAGCGTCGGKGCRRRGDGCCTRAISASGVMCSESGAAPCIIDDVIDAEYTGFEALGCYESTAANPLMPFTTSFSGMYAQKCFDICQGENPDYTHFGLLNGFECSCGIDTDLQDNFAAAKLDDSECNEECPLFSQTCGGELKMNVFEIKQLEGVNPRVGCFDTGSLTMSSATSSITSFDMTREICQMHCAEAGTAYYGLVGTQWYFQEYENECICGDEYNADGEIIYSRNGDLIVDSCEEEPCGGNTLEACGGTQALVIYRTDVPLN